MGFNYFLAEHICGALNQFKKAKRTGYPSDLNSMEEWDHIIDNMIFAFEQIRKNFARSSYSQYYDKKHKENPNYDFLYDNVSEAIRKDEDAYQDKIRQGLSLFAKYFQSLWD